METFLDIASVVIRIALYLAIAYWLWSFEGPRKVLDALPPVQRRFLVGFFALFLLGQIVGLKYQTYPFVKWGMYSSFSGHVKYFEYAGVREDGVEELFPIARLVRIYDPLCPTCGKRFVWKLRNMGKERRKTEAGPELEDLIGDYEGLLRAGWAQYLKQNPDQTRYSELRVRFAHVRTADYVDESSIERELVWSVALE